MLLTPLNLLALAVACALGLAVVRYLRREQRTSEARAIHENIRGPHLDQPLSLRPVIDVATCTGCGECVKVCPEGDVLRVRNEKAVPFFTTRCLGHGECEAVCPVDAIKLVRGRQTRGLELPHLARGFASGTPGVYFAGEVGGMGLLHNAVKQAVTAVTHALEKLEAVPAQTDVLIVGAGPAGVAAALAVIAKKKTYILIEQGTFAGTIANFPRHRLVLNEALELPKLPKKKFANNPVSKEEFLSYWEEVRAKSGLKVREGTKFESFEKIDGVFHAQTALGVVTARKIILCMGTRGSPRKLGLKGESLPKVTYTLEDSEQYVEKRVVVVGGGDAAAESVQALAQPTLRNKVYMIVSAKELNECGPQNAGMVKHLAKLGRIALWLDAEVTLIEADRVVVRVAGETKAIKNDYVIVRAGAENRQDFLVGLGA